MLSERNRQIAILKATTAMTNKEISQHVNVHYNTIGRVLKRADVKELISQIQGSVQEKVIDDFVTEIDKAATPAFKKLLDLMENASSPAVQFRACESVLDRSTVAPKKILHSKHEVDQRVMRVTIGGAELKRMHEVLLEGAENPEDVPPFPELNERGEYVVEIDPVTGDILREGLEK